MDFRRLWETGLTYEEFLRASTENCALWEGVHRTARIPAWATETWPAGTERRLLALVEDWCGDASNTVPVVVRLAEEIPGLELRLLRRDEHPEVMDRYLTNGARSIPIVIALDEAFRELGHWGPRPAELQAWVMANRKILPKEELYPQVRRWYARDRGESTLREVLAVAGLSPAEAA